MNYRWQYHILAFVVPLLILQSEAVCFVPLPLMAQTKTPQERNSEAIKLFYLGLEQYNQGKYQEALETLQQALIIVRDIQARQGESLILYQIGQVYEKLRAYTKAIEFYQQALAIGKEIYNQDLVGKIHNQIGEVYRQMQNYNQALQAYQQALNFYKQINNPIGQGLTLNYIGQIYNELKEDQKALDAYQQALAILIKLNDKLGLVATYKNLGFTYENLGEYSKALDAYQQALALIPQTEYPVGAGAILDSIASVYTIIGKYTKALDIYQQALETAKKANNQGGESLTLHNIGGVYYRLGQYPQALKFYQQALALSRQISEKVAESSILNSIGLVYQQEEKYQEALPFYQAALKIVRTDNNLSTEKAAAILNNIGLAYRGLGEYNQALDVYQQSLAIINRGGSEIGKGTTLNNIGVVYFHLKEYGKALEFSQQALAIRQRIGDRAGVGDTLNNIGAVYQSLKDYDKAEKTLLAALEIWESLRQGLTDAQKISIFENQAKSYRLLQEVLIAQNKINSALEVSDRARARAFIELLAAKQSQTANPQLDIKPLTIEQIQNIAKVENATIVQYSIIDDKLLYIWLIKPTGEITFKPVDLSKATDTPLSQLVTISRKAMGVLDRGIFQPQSSLQPNPTQQLQKLYQILIKPIVQDLPTDANARVIFVPQESLFVVPFAALQDEQGKYLIDKHTILTAPAIQVLELTRKQKQNLNQSLKDVLVVGNPMMPKIPITEEKLAPLPGAEKEAKQIAELLKTQAIIGNKATETTIVSKMKQARIIHFATHGLLDDFKGLGVPGAIALTASNQDDGFLTSSEILDMKLSAELVVLSACNTGGGNITGDGVIGLSRSLITAGVPSVIVSLWAVNDDSTAFLMSEFYRQLQKNPDKAVALRQAILTTKKQYSHPFDWAAFTLIGEAD
ncbi:MULTISPECIES: CHAT domain-containing tetratricopeptide repeat protein [Calothrix]|uniref:Tetratricopeptide repeat protein n=3 Tax=Calothrix TaxID=1186 RepID=A0ABR8AQF2_9CYAN|nr:tetratricopeptide repeat protein [Calothrix anomala]MBD2194159.1 tetratricopeptide repeat protein [Calothrix parietina FACHB-288]MBD2194514.1 tetratricopeptide repeat protein [Calothrix parietina FACHB-288]MBD2223380.1 tetratricopeptide repeat protein [Calothrix anomala FACHB-343]MBD2224151.1 tetratricopeptide repeat protein [Calothrix anomala FACHB-343]